MTRAPGSQLLRRAPQVRWRRFGPDGILLDPVSGEYLQVDEIGVLVWEYLDPPVTLDDLVQRLTSDFNIGADQIEDDVRDFVAALARQNFLVLNPS
jgi:hypothetical protein